MMLGMSGMMPPEMPGVNEAAGAGASPGAPTGVPAPAIGVSQGAPAVASAPDGTAAAVPPEVIAAMMQGDVAGLASLLRAEHARRQGELPPGGGATGDEPPSFVGDAALRSAPLDPAAAAPPGIDKALIDELIRVASENQVTVDWLMLRAATGSRSPHWL
jgi:hypothetical protein